MPISKFLKIVFLFALIVIPFDIISGHHEAVDNLSSFITVFHNFAFTCLGFIIAIVTMKEKIKNGKS